MFLGSSCSCGCCSRGGGRRCGLAQPRAACPWLVWGPVRRLQRAPRELSRGSTRLQQAPEVQIGSRMFQEASRGPNRPQEFQLAPGSFQGAPRFSRGFQLAPKGPRRPKEAPGGPSRPQDPARPSQPGFPQQAPQRSTHGQLTVNTTVNTRSTQRSTSPKIIKLLKAC